MVRPTRQRTREAHSRVSVRPITERRIDAWVNPFPGGMMLAVSIDAIRPLKARDTSYVVVASMSDSPERSCGSPNCSSPIPIRTSAAASSCSSHRPGGDLPSNSLRHRPRTVVDTGSRDMILSSVGRGGLLLAAALMLVACGTDASGGPAGDAPPRTSADGAAGGAGSGSGAGSGDAPTPQPVGRCDPTVRPGDDRVVMGGAGWDSAGYPLEPLLAPPMGSCLRIAFDVPLDSGDAGPYGARLWTYALAAGTDVEMLCRDALRILQQAGPVGVDGDPCAPFRVETARSDGGVEVARSHRFDALTTEDVLVTVVASEVEDAAGCDADPGEESGPMPDCLTLLVGFRRVG